MFTCQRSRQRLKDSTSEKNGCFVKALLGGLGGVEGDQERRNSGGESPGHSWTFLRDYHQQSHQILLLPGVVYQREGSSEFTLKL